jgi:hypothetical protein
MNAWLEAVVGGTKLELYVYDTCGGETYVKDKSALLNTEVKSKSTRMTPSPRTNSMSILRRAT